VVRDGISSSTGLGVPGSPARAKETGVRGSAEPRILKFIG
jgi:hypothetical protein